jgi:hypothetical protein
MLNRSLPSSPDPQLQSASFWLPAYFLLVKSVSSADEPLLSLLPQVHESISSVSFPSSYICRIQNIPSARFPHAQVLVGSLFSVVAFSQAIDTLVRPNMHKAVSESKRTALESRLLAAGASSFLCAYALAVVTSAASHGDVKWC